MKSFSAGMMQPRVTVQTENTVTPSPGEHRRHDQGDQCPPIIPPYALMMSGLWLATSPRFTWPCTEERNHNALIPEANVVASAALP